MTDGYSLIILIAMNCLHECINTVSFIAAVLNCEVHVQSVCVTSQLDMQGYLASHVSLTTCAFAYPNIPNLICSTKKLPEQADVGTL